MTDRMLRVMPAALRDADILRLKMRLIDAVAPSLQKVPAKDLNRQNVRASLDKTLESFNSGYSISMAVSLQVVDAALADLIGYGPLELLLDDPEISEINAIFIPE